jgi:hypothetical protein
MKIPVFVSCPTILNANQEASRKIMLEELDFLRLEHRAIGTSDYPTDLPLREVYVLATHCSGGIILGFEQFYAESGIFKRGTSAENVSKNGVAYPSPWNQLEAGILFGLGVPLLVFRESGINGGIFDIGVSDVFIHPMPQSDITSDQRQKLRDIMLKWQSRVREHYYRTWRATE